MGYRVYFRGTDSRGEEFERMFEVVKSGNGWTLYGCNTGKDGETVSRSREGSCREPVTAAIAAFDLVRSTDTHGLKAEVEEI